MLTMTDLFCGAGGSSQGAVQVPGVELRIAANHWQLAVETHAENFPDADHDTANISQVDFRRYPATDLLWASPECTNHSQARGVSRRAQDGQPDLFGEVLPDEAALRSRATMHDVPRALEVGILRGRPYAGFVVENVVEARQWMYWRSWWAAITEDAGYCAHVVSLNSMHAQVAGLPAPQSRDRLYVVGHLRAIRCPDLAKWVAPQAWCPPCARVVSARQAWKPGRVVGRYRAQYVYVCPVCHRPVEPGWLPAAAAIDWGLPGERIGDRGRPLAPKTLARIEAGLRKYARPEPRSFLTVHRGGPLGGVDPGQRRPRGGATAGEDRRGARADEDAPAGRRGAELRLRRAGDRLRPARRRRGSAVPGVPVRLRRLRHAVRRGLRAAPGRGRVVRGRCRGARSGGAGVTAGDREPLWLDAGLSAPVAAWVESPASAPAEQPDRRPSPKLAAAAAAGELTPVQADRILRLIVTQLVEDRDALAAALLARTHPFQPHPAGPGQVSGCAADSDHGAPDAAVHRTPGVVLGRESR
jgi:DNA (cytosine-5)-methyltransferase 1